jgi:eukaryotic-like serine/threonine-protein kinase
MYRSITSAGRALIETHGLTVGKLIYVPDIAVNNVLRQQYTGKDVKPGELIIRGESIDLVLGEGLSKQTTAVPDLFYIITPKQGTGSLRLPLM